MVKDIDRKKFSNLVEQYKQHIEQELGTNIPQKKVESVEYQEFKKQFMPKHLTLYEKLCNLSEKILKIKPDKKYKPVLEESIKIAHLNVSSTGATSFSYLLPLFIIFFGGLISYALFQSMFFILFFFLIAIVSLRPLAKLPEYIANNWRMKASNQMVLCIFYVVTYMRHTSNLENAIEFAAEHLGPPLSLDLKKVLWDVETEEYPSIKESLDVYLQTWRKWNMEFIEAFHLVEGSLYEGSEERRLNALDKALDVILDETYEKMLHYAHNLQSPITMLHMLGIILPILGLVILPLVASFMDNVRWYHIATLYNLTIPVAVYLLGKATLSKRPTGYGENDISDDKYIKKYKNVLVKFGKTEIQINPLIFSIVIGVILLLIGLSPVIMHVLNFEDIGIIATDEFGPCGYYKYCLLEYRMNKLGDPVGPFGLGASLLSLFVPAAIGLSLGLYFRLRSKNVIKIRERAKKLELEFASALFQLGNRLGDGLPVEIAFDKVSDVMEGTVSGSFFQLVSINIKKLGMGVKRAIFDPQYGAILRYPSSMIDSSMKVLVESIKKGPVIAAQALTNVSRYIKEIHKVNERLKDLMADIISQMKSQIKFLTPAIAGIVIGITSLVSNILGKLGGQLSKITENTGGPSAGAEFMEIFGQGIPTFYFQIVVGLYVVQITYILTILSNGIENGADKLNGRFLLGKNLINSTLLYCMISGVVILLFNIIANAILVTINP